MILTSKREEGLHERLGHTFNCAIACSLHAFIYHWFAQASGYQVANLDTVQDAVTGKQYNNMLDVQSQPSLMQLVEVSSIDAVLQAVFVIPAQQNVFLTSK